MAPLSSVLESVTPAALLATGGALALGVYLATSETSSQAPGDAQEAPRVPGSSYLLGDLVAVLRNESRFHDWMTETTLAFDGKPWMLRIPGQKDMVLVSSPEGVEEILGATNADKFPKGEFQIDNLAVMFGHSVVNSDGSRWFHQRKAAAKFFTAKSLRTCMTSNMHKNVLQMFEVLDASIASQKPFNLGRLFHEFALQTFCEVGLGVDLRWIGSDEPNPLEHAMEVSTVALLRRFRLPVWYWHTLRYLNVSSERQMAEAMESVREWIRNVINKSLAATTRKSQADSSAPKSVMELFLEQSHENTEGMGPEDLVDFILTFVIAANDTSAVALTWFFLLMKKYPAVERKLRDEMAAVLPAMGVTQDTYLTTDHTQRLVYLEATIKEVLRLYPPVPLTERQASEDTVVAGNTFIRKGTMVGVSSYTMARLPSVWGPDAAEFKPERWIDPESGAVRTIPSSRFPTFSSGPRTCIGMKLAMLELRVAAANLLHRYEFSLAQPNDGSYVVATGLSLKHPLIINATRRGVAMGA